MRILDHDLNPGNLRQAVLLGLAVGLFWGGYSTWPRPPVLIPGTAPSPRRDPVAVPLPRFIPGMSGFIVRDDSPLRAPAIAVAPERPSKPRVRPTRDRPASTIVQPPEEIDPGSGSGNSSEPDEIEPIAIEPESIASEVTPEARPENSDLLDNAMESFDRGRELYRVFVAGEGDRSKSAPRAREALEHALDALRAAQLARPGKARMLEERIEESTYYLGFINHFGN